MCVYVYKYIYIYIYHDSLRPTGGKAKNVPNIFARAIPCVLEKR